MNKLIKIFSDVPVGLRAILFIGLIFLILRFAGIHIPYHQDEWKNISAASSIETAGAFFSHPPLMQMAFVMGRSIFGENNFRFAPLIFLFATLFLLYKVVKNRVNRDSAIWSVVLFSICFYSVLGSLQPDVDGSILPFFFLLAVYAYDRLNSGRKWFWLILLTCLLGLLTKLSFIIVIGVLTVEYAWNSLSTRDLTVKKSLIGVLKLWRELGAFQHIKLSLGIKIGIIGWTFTSHTEKPPSSMPQKNWLAF